MNEKAKNESLRIRSESVLRNLFLDEVVKYRIQEMLRVDPFIGFDLELVISSDSFEAAVRNLLDRSIGITSTDRYMQIESFLFALDLFNKKLSEICYPSSDGSVVKCSNQDKNTNKHLIIVDELRRKAQGYLNEIDSR